MRIRTGVGLLFILALVGIAVSIRDFAPSALPRGEVVPVAEREPAAEADAPRGKTAPRAAKSLAINTTPPPPPPPPPRSRGDEDPADLLARKYKRANVAPGRDDPRSAPMERYRGLNRKALASGVRRNYLVLGARAIAPERYSAAFGPVLFEEMGRRIVADDAEGWADLKTSAEGQPLLVNQSTGRLAVVTGTIEISVADVETAEAAATEERLSLISFDRTIGLAHLRAPNNFALAPAVERLSHRPGVSGVQLELFESQKVPQ